MNEIWMEAECCVTDCDVSCQVKATVRISGTFKLERPVITMAEILSVPEGWTVIGKRRLHCPGHGPAKKMVEE